MTDLMINLRRSPRKLLELDGHAPAPGRLALVMARAGVGKTAFLVGIGIDALLGGQRVLHISLASPIDKVRTWYDDILIEMMRIEKKLGHLAAIQIDVERRRHIHTYLGSSFTPERMRDGIRLLTDVMRFTPQVIILDDLEGEQLDVETLAGVKEIAKEVGAELWMACQIHREGPQGEPGHLPPPADQIEEIVDLAFRLDPQERKTRLHVLKDRDKMLDEDLHILLDPQTLLLSFGA